MVQFQVLLGSGRLISFTQSRVNPWGGNGLNFDIQAKTLSPSVLKRKGARVLIAPVSNLSGCSLWLLGPSLLPTVLFRMRIYGMLHPNFRSFG
jgi:hypothetical protein